MPPREYHSELPSTQREAVRRAREGCEAGLRVVAARQSAGRGRLDHRWESPDGGLYLSLVVRSPHEDRTLLPLAVGAEIGRAVAERYGVATWLKWPNDLLVVADGHGRKLAGVLVDEVDSPTLGRAAVVGVGFNVLTPRAAFSPELRARVVSLGELTASPPSLDEVERLVATAVTAAAEALDHPGGHDRILEACRSRLYGLGRTATVDGALRGVITALGDEGELWLSTEVGPVAVRTGDVVVEEA